MVVVRRRSSNQWRVVSGAPLNVIAADAPTSVAATSPSSGVLRVTWGTPADDGGGDILKYRVTAAPQGGGASTVVDAGALDRETLVVGLVAGTAYAISVAAVNGSGTGTAGVAGGAVNVTPDNTTTVP